MNIKQQNNKDDPTGSQKLKDKEIDDLIAYRIRYSGGRGFVRDPFGVRSESVWVRSGSVLFSLRYSKFQKFSIFPK